MSAGQRQKILRLLIDANGSWIPSFELANASLQYSARIHELRVKGHAIESKVVPGPNGSKYGYFRIQQVVSVENGVLVTTAARKPPTPERATAPQDSLFGDLAKTHCDDG